MAIIFELWAECRNKDETRALAHHFAGLSFTLLTGRTVSWTPEISDRLAPCSLVVTSRDLSPYGVRTVADAIESTEAGLRLYHHLKSAPPFRFARVAWEAANIPLRDLPTFVEMDIGGKPLLDLECVVDAELYAALGSPAFFEEFREGYLWRRYRGETYRPLYGNDQEPLNQLCRSLFPEYFNY